MKQGAKTKTYTGKLEISAQSDTSANRRLRYSSAKLIAASLSQNP
jgi:hypothetical protein